MTTPAMQLAVSVSCCPLALVKDVVRFSPSYKGQLSFCRFLLTLRLRWLEKGSGKGRGDVLILENGESEIPGAKV